MAFVCIAALSLEQPTFSVNLSQIISAKSEMSNFISTCLVNFHHKLATLNVSSMGGYHSFNTPEDSLLIVGIRNYGL